jgi:tRNA(Ile)-lysidine synthase
MSELSLHKLAPRWAHFCLGVCSFLQGELDLDVQGKTILLAASRGVDSTALILWAYMTQARLKTQVNVAHLHHGLRPEADTEADSLRHLCSSLSLKLYYGRTNASVYAKRQSLGLEEAGRILRYRFLVQTARKTGAHYLLTAHHLNDLAEDVLLRLIRGTGWPALAGMSAWVQKLHLVRPFLLTPKQDLTDFVQACGQDWLEDASNQDLSFTRNRIRHQILPLFFQENPGFLGQTADLWRQAQTDASYWDQKLQECIKSEPQLPQGILLPAERLKSLHPAQRLRWYRNVLDRLGPGQALAGNLFRLDRAWREHNWHKCFQFPGNKEIQVTPQGLLCTVVIS